MNILFVILGINSLALIGLNIFTLWFLWKKIAEKDLVILTMIDKGKEVSPAIQEMGLGDQMTDIETKEQENTMIDMSDMTNADIAKLNQNPHRVITVV